LSRAYPPQVRIYARLCFTRPAQFACICAMRSKGAGRRLWSMRRRPPIRRTARGLRRAHRHRQSRRQRIPTSITFTTCSINVTTRCCSRRRKVFLESFRCDHARWARTSGANSCATLDRDASAPARREAVPTPVVKIASVVPLAESLVSSSTQFTPTVALAAPTLSAAPAPIAAEPKASNEPTCRQVECRCRTFAQEVAEESNQ